MLDGLVGMLLMLPVLIPYLADVFDDIDAGGDGTNVEVPASFLAGSIVIGIAWLLMVAFVGATPGKLMLGLRITTADGATTPPGMGPAVLRALPSLAGLIPIIGQLIPVGFAVASLVWVSRDPERRSAYDRIANTRVVRKSYLTTAPGQTD